MGQTGINPLQSCHNACILYVPDPRAGTWHAIHSVQAGLGEADSTRSQFGMLCTAHTPDHLCHMQCWIQLALHGQCMPCACPGAGMCAGSPGASWSSMPHIWLDHSHVLHMAWCAVHVAPTDWPCILASCLARHCVEHIPHASPLFHV